MNNYKKRRDNINNLNDNTTIWSKYGHEVVLLILIKK